VRHPNFAAEQAIWIFFYFFGVAASAQWLNWTVTGPVLLILLFIGSSEMTERISMTKYPDYIIYKQSIPKFIPKIIKPTRPNMYRNLAILFFYVVTVTIIFILRNIISFFSRLFKVFRNFSKYLNAQK
jgi:hypothetical protein